MNYRSAHSIFAISLTVTFLIFKLFFMHPLTPCCINIQMATKSFVLVPHLTSSSNSDGKASVLLNDREYFNFRWNLDDTEIFRCNLVINFQRKRPKTNHCVMCGNSNCTIPSQNKGVCKSCDSSFWYSNELDVVFKFCKGCKTFCTLHEFGDKPVASKCLKCRKRGSISYFMKKSESSTIAGKEIINDESIRKKRRVDHSNTTDDERNLSTSFNASDSFICSKHSGSFESGPDRPFGQVTPMMKWSHSRENELGSVYSTAIELENDPLSSVIVHHTRVIQVISPDCAPLGGSPLSCSENVTITRSVGDQQSEKENYPLLSIKQMDYNFISSNEPAAAVIESSPALEKQPQWWNPLDPLMNLATLTTEQRYQP